VISWGSIVYGAVLSAIAAAALIAVALRERRLAVLAGAVAGAAAGPLAWNAILRDVGADGFFVDAPFALLPASWQDTGSGVFAVAVTALLLAFGPLAEGRARRVGTAALLCGLAAFLVDVYLY
jgi:hypothetical protein